MWKFIPVFLTCCSLVAGATRTDESTGLIFPDEISRWIFSGSRSYEPKALGVSYTYKSKLQREGAITCYIYSKDFPAIATGADSPEVRKEMAELAWAVGEGWRRQGGTVEEVMPISEVKTSDGSILALLCGHRIIVRGVTNISISALTGCRNNFVKIRFTFPGNDFQSALDGLGGFREFLNEMKEVNSTSLDPYFLREKPTGKAASKN